MTSTRLDPPSDLPAPHTEEVADGVFAYIQPDGSWWINNTGFVAGTSNVLAIDTCSTERRTRAFVAEIERVAGQVPRMLLNTHHHGDHTNGNCLLPYATIFGHKRCREEMVKAGGILRPEGIFQSIDWGDLEPALPFVTFDDQLDVHVGDHLVQLRHIGTAAHTTNDVVAWLPEQRVLFTGDLVFNGGTPFVLMGSVSGALVALDLLTQYPADVVVPGHGEVCSMESIDLVGEYLRFVQMTAEQARAAGLSPLETAREVDLDSCGFGHLLDPERLVGNLYRAFAECDGTRPGDPIDLVAAFNDMVAFNGGKPLGCLA